jgi:hypothetical protein
MSQNGTSEAQELHGIEQLGWTEEGRTLCLQFVSIF